MQIICHLNVHSNLFTVPSRCLVVDEWWTSTEREWSKPNENDTFSKRKGMFYERHDSHMLDSHMAFLADGAHYDDMCSTSNLKDDHWKKVQNLLPTPPCSPEELCYQGFPELIPAPPSFQHGLQVVPDEIPDDLVDADFEPLPVLELSDEEMQKLTSPTIFDDTMWQQSQPNLAQPAATPSVQHEQFENTTNISDVNYISHGIRTVHISDSVVRTPGFSQSFVLTVNANPIQPLNSMGHLITREILINQNAGINSGETHLGLFFVRFNSSLHCHRVNARVHVSLWRTTEAGSRWTRWWER